MNLAIKMFHHVFIYNGKTYKKGDIVYVTSEEYNYIQSIYSSEELKEIYFLTKRYNFDSNDDIAIGLTINMTPTYYSLEQRLSSQYYNDDSYVVGRIIDYEDN